MAWAPQSTRNSLRNRIIESSVCAEIRCGDEWGHRDRSTNLAGASSSNRRRYLSSVCREIASSGHSAVTFTGTPLENTASSFASIGTTTCAMPHSIKRQLGVSDVSRQKLSAITRETTFTHYPLIKRNLDLCTVRETNADVAHPKPLRRCVSRRLRLSSS